MSRSTRRTKIFGNSLGISDKPHKVTAHRQERRAVSVALTIRGEPPISKEFGNPAVGPRDGKSYWPNATARDMRK